VLSALAALAGLSVLPLSSQPADWRTWLDNHAAGFSGVVLVARGDTIEVEAAYGLAAPAGTRRNTSDTRFNLGSINKTFTAVAVAQLIQQGRLSLDDTLAKHLPDYQNQAAAARITIRHLLTHRSGVAQFMRADFGDVSVASWHLVGKRSGDGDLKATIQVGRLRVIVAAAAAAASPREACQK
jgi:CubicO group peptidase (beta-lactamase class C family)